jgi:hypothetical protein
MAGIENKSEVVVVSLLIPEMNMDMNTKTVKIPGSVIIF